MNDRQELNHGATGRIASRRLQSLLAGFALTVLAAGSAQANVDIADAPLFVTSSVDPNLVFVIDDSGSMQWETMPDELTKYYGENLTREVVMWMYPRVANLHGGSPQYDNTRTVRFSGNNAALFRSSHNNTVYYNPAVTYRPWSNADGSLMPAADPTAAPNRPLFPTFGTRNLTVNNTQTTNWLANSASTHNSTSVTFYPAVYYHYESGPIDQESSYTRVEIRSTTPLYTGHGRENRSDCSDVLSGVCTYAEEIQNFANWYSYHRNRIFAARAGIGRAFAAQGEGVRVGYGAINKGSTTIDGASTATVVRGIRPFQGADRVAFFDELYTRDVPAAGTPLRNALKGVGEYFQRTDSRGPWSSTPGSTGGVDLTCRQSFAILMSDGYWNGPDPGVGNTDGLGTITHTGPGGITGGYTPGPPFSDNRSNTLADVAMQFWKNDLRPDLANRVPASARNPAFWQHMVTYTIGLGVQGAIDPETAFAAIQSGDSVSWPNPTAGDSEKIDDMLHAAVNGRGGFFSAADAETFSRELSEVLADIVARVESSATSAATSSAVLQTDTLLYTAGFRSGDWSGRLDARAVNPDGSVGSLVWDAEYRLTQKNPLARNIITRRSDTGVAVALTFANLSPAQQAALNRNPGGTSDGLGSERVAWLRGIENGAFRSRNESGSLRLLGDIVNSNPKFNEGVLYVGANDGMLHAFDAETGEELFAYVPSTLLTAEGGNTHASLSELMDPDYAHRYFVDGTPSVLDLSFSGTPKTVLVGSMGAGGRTIFALDVTNPSTFGPGDVMWEFSHPELGYNVGPPAIVQLNNGDLAAVFGNGYNSQSNRAMLFVVNLNTGSLIQTIDTGEGTAGNPNGLAAPVATDWPVSNLRVNRVYAGDLHGNLWRFNMGGNPSTWNDAGNVSVLFTARSSGGVAQPITASPVVALNPVNNNEVVVAFGTGSYFRGSDQNVQGQTLYGILDTKVGVNGVARADLLTQTITSTTYTVGGENIGVRIVSENDFDPATHKGWLVDLPEAGERVITEATFPSGPTQRRVRFSTLIPDEDPCGTGRRGYLMDLDLVAGGRVPYSVFDLNRDGSYDEGDMIGDAPVSGVAWGQGERPTLLTPADQSGDPPEFLYTGEGEYVKGLGEEGLGGRQSWQQLR